MPRLQNSNVLEALVQALREATPSPLFALMGDGNQELIVAFAGSGREIIEARHEQNAVAMADGYARFTGHIGLCTVTQGPGLTNAGTSLAVAASANSPVLLLAGQTARGDLNNPQRLNQTAFALATCAAEATVAAPRALGGALARALAHFADHRGAFVLNLPTDVQTAELDQDSRPWSFNPPSSFGPTEGSLGEAARLIGAAKRPAIVAGAGALETEDAIVILAEHLGAPIALSLKAKGLAHDHPLAVGVAGGLGTPDAARMLRASDLIIAVGISLNAWTTSFGETIRHCPVIQIDRSPAAFGLHTPVDMPLVGVAEPTLAALMQHLNAGARKAWWSGGSRPDESYEDRRDGKPDPKRVLDVISRTLPQARIIVADGGHCVQATCQRMTVRARRWAYSFDFGCIGQGLGLAIGATFAYPGERVTLITGDASLLMNVGDLDTASRYGLPLTIIVLNDDGFGQERHALKNKGLPPEYAMLKAPDFVSLVHAVGGRGYRFSTVEQLDELPATLSQAESSRHLCLFDIAINGDVQLPVSSEIARHLR